MCHLPPLCLLRRTTLAVPELQRWMCKITRLYPFARHQSQLESATPPPEEFLSSFSILSQIHQLARCGLAMSSGVSPRWGARSSPLAQARRQSSAFADRGRTSEYRGGVGGERCQGLQLTQETSSFPYHLIQILTRSLNGTHVPLGDAHQLPNGAFVDV